MIAAARWALLWLLASVPACASLKDPALAARIEAIPAAQRDSVHAWLVNSPIDPLCLGGLPSLAHALRDAGFSNVNFRLIPNADALAADVRNCKSSNPGAAIALIGWSGASLSIWDATTSVAAEALTIDLIVYLDSNWIKDRIRQRGHPENFDRLLLIYRAENPPPDISRAEVVTVETGNHLAVPCRSETIEALAKALAKLAESSE